MRGRRRSIDVYLCCAAADCLIRVREDDDDGGTADVGTATGDETEYPVAVESGCLDLKRTGSFPALGGRGCMVETVGLTNTHKCVMQMQRHPRTLLTGKVRLMLTTIWKFSNERNLISTF